MLGDLCYIFGCSALSDPVCMLWNTFFLPVMYKFDVIFFLGWGGAGEGRVGTKFSEVLARPLFLLEEKVLFLVHCVILTLVGKKICYAKQ